MPCAIISIAAGSCLRHAVKCSLARMQRTRERLSIGGDVGFAGRKMTFKERTEQFDTIVRASGLDEPVAAS